MFNTGVHGNAMSSGALRKSDVLAAIEVISANASEVRGNVFKGVEQIQDSKLQRLTISLCKWGAARETALGRDLVWKSAYIILAAHIGYGTVAWTEAQDIPHEGIRRALLQIASRHTFDYRIAPLTA